MQEIELKFQIPANRVSDVLLAVQALPAAAQALNPLPLHAAYFDTPEHHLARQRMALRVRQEGPERVQTFKGAGADALTRLEENLALPPLRPGTPAQPELLRHSAAVQSGLRRALPHWQHDADPHGQRAGLRASYETRFQRWQGLQSHPQGEVLVCLDTGALHAQALREPLTELELELLSGSPRAVIGLARHWVQQHGVWLDVQSKAMKGTRLAHQATSGQPLATEVVHPKVPCPVPGDELSLWRTWLADRLDACAGNAAEVHRQASGAAAALHAWRDALQGLAKALPDSPWADMPAGHRLQNRSTVLLDALTGAMGAAPQEHRDHAAPAVVTHPDTSLWALDLLDLLYPS